MNLKSEYSRGGIIAILLLMLTPAVATACTCALMPSTCDIEWKRGQIVFLGKVIALDSIPNPQSTAEYRFHGQIAVHFSVTETFRGGAGVGQEIIVHTGVGGGDCGYPFKVGTSYLVYVLNYQTQLATSICTQTCPQRMAAGASR